MKKLLLFVIACTLGLFGTVSAQETLFYEDFESGSLENWNIFQDAGATAANWQLGDGSVTGGYQDSKAVYCCSWSGSDLKCKNYIVTKTAYPISETTEIQWYVKHSAANYAASDNYNVVVSEDGESFAKASSDLVYSIGEEQQSFSLSAYAGKTLYVGFYHGGQGGEYLMIDNIHLLNNTAGEGGGEEPEQPEAEPISEFFFDFNDGSMTGLRVFKDSLSQAANWQVSADGDTYYSGYENTRAIYSCSWDNNFVWPYNYVVTVNPCTITATSELSWFMRPSDAAYADADKYQVVASTDGVDFNIVLWTGTAASATENTLPLAEYAGETLYLGFYHYTEGTPGDAIVLDNIKLTAGEGGGEEPTPEPEPEPEGPVTVTIGEGNYDKGYYAPISNYGDAKYSYSQQIYLQEEIGKENGLITSIAFHNKYGGPNTRNIIVYMSNTEVSSYASTEPIAVTAENVVYQGEFTFGANEEWATIVLQNPFVYEGDNIIVTFNDVTGIANNYSGYDAFYSTKTTEPRGIYAKSGYYAFDCLNLGGYFYSLNTGTYNGNIPYVADIQLTIEALAADVKVEPETIALGDAQVGEYWSEKEATTVDVTITPIATTITNITCDNDFFVLPTLDLTAGKLKFKVAYNKNAAAGEYTGNLTITYGDGATKVVPMTATAYAPATPDVFELAQEITFTENAYTDTPVFANLHDDYNLPKEEGANAPDAVYAFELAKESIVAVEVTGTNANYAIYKAEDLAGNGPKADNNYVGEIVATDAPVSFFYDFSEENVLDNFTLLNRDSDSYNWRIETTSGIDGATLKSDSYYNSLTLYPDNYIVTAEKYEITDNSVLSFKYLTSQYKDRFGVEVSTDGENFTNVWNDKVASSGTVVEQVVPLSAYAGQSVYIALRHYDSNGNEGWYVLIDDLKLESGLPNSFAAGKYYLVVAAEDAFSVNVNVEKLPTAPEAPVVAATALSDTEIALTWEAVEDALSYNIYSADTLVANVTELTYTVTKLAAETEYSFVVKAVNEVGESEASNVATATTLVPAPTFADYRLESVATSWGNTVYTYDEENANRVVAIDEDGIVSEVTYNEAGQIASAVATVEEVDEEGNPVETVISGVEYEYDENGVWTSFTETVQGWFGGTVTSETVLNYDAEGRLVSLTSEEYARTIAYNEAGLISEVIEGYILVEEEGEEGDEEGDDNGIAPLSETEIEYSSKITFEYDAEGRLVKKDYYFYDAYETMEFYWAESEVYTYDENGNCVKKESYEVTEENELNSFPYSVAEYIYDLTISNEDVYSFEYPHFAFINYVEPSYVNILLKEKSFYSYYDEDAQEVLSHSYEVTAYNYNPAVLTLPEKPMNLTAEVMSATEVELAWAGFPDAESFTLYQGEAVLAEGLVDPYYTVENLEMGVEYCFAVMATNSVGNSEVSETVCVTIELPAAPANLVAKATSETEIALTWDEVPGIYSYNVYQVVETAEETTYELLGEAWWTEYTVTELTAETEYSFVVKAVSNVGESAASNVATATTLAPAAPTVPAAPVVTGSFEGDKVILEWEAVEGAFAYNLYYGGNLLAGPFEDLVVEIQVPEEGTYCFTVTALNEVGESKHSEEVCVTVTAPEDMEAPAAPVLEATLDGNKAILSWEAVEGATYYDVYIGSTPEQAQYLGTATMEDLPISLELPEPGEYCFFVVAYNLAGASEPSNVACVNYGEGVEENEASFNIYPNPVSDRLVIETEANIEAVTIYTVTGVVVYSEVDFNDNTIDVSDFANGVYIMKVRTENGEAVQRFIKK